jgi:hypothetical protein
MHNIGEHQLLSTQAVTITATPQLSAAKLLMYCHHRSSVISSVAVLSSVAADARAAAPNRGSLLAVCARASALHLLVLIFTAVKLELRMHCKLPIHTQLTVALFEKQIVTAATLLHAAKIDAVLWFVDATSIAGKRSIPACIL